MQLQRTPTPFNTPWELREYEKRCNQPHSQVEYPPKDYIQSWKKTPNIGTSGSPYLLSSQDDCRQFGYQPKRYNPGSLKFYMYDYPFHTTFGVPYRNVGRGWNKYEATGQYYK